MNSKEGAQKLSQRESLWGAEWIDLASVWTMGPPGVDHMYSLDKWLLKK